MSGFSGRRARRMVKLWGVRAADICPTAAWGCKCGFDCSMSDHALTRRALLYAPILLMSSSPWE